MIASTDAARTSKAAAVALAAVGVVLMGPALPVSQGWGLPVAAVAILGLVSVWRDAGGAYHSVPALGRGAHSATLLVWLSAAALAAIAASVAVGVTVAFPGSIWAVPVILTGAAIAGWVGPRARLPVAIGMALLVPAAGVLGARHEAAGSDASGWAHSGPIHGIHPFQMTAIRIDGYGPFDVPINDYVEPEAGRGYNPETFADALERALHDIAEVHYAKGPARAQAAYANATVEAITLPAVQETLGVSPGAETQPRIIVRSGGWGQHSRVEFLCPGKRDEPGGPEPDKLLSRMCPNKYASEASAGLGVTGRWPGYTEGRGQPRVGIAPANAQTRSDVSVVRAERRTGALVWLGLGLLVLFVPKGRSLLERGAPRFTAAVAVAGLTAAVVLAFETTPGVGGARIWETGGAGPWSAWWPALLLLAGMPEIRARAAGAGTSWTVAVLVVATAAVAATVAHSAWIVPQIGAGSGQPLERWILGAADVLSMARGLDVFEAEHGIASMVVAVLAGGSLAIVARAGVSVAQHSPPLRSAPQRVRVPVAVVAIVAAAASFIWSRKTLGGATLLPGAIGLTVVLHSGLAWARSRSPLRGVLLVGSTILSAWLWVAAVQNATHPSNGYVLVVSGLGVLVSLSGFLFLLPRPKP
ncbi:MAG: hypothetical protein ACRBN8_37815 [Nannocystales bacterium]